MILALASIIILPVVAGYAVAFSKEDYNGPYAMSFIDAP